MRLTNNISHKVYAAFSANLREPLVSGQRSAADVNRVHFAEFRGGDDAVPVTAIAA